MNDSPLLLQTLIQAQQNHQLVELHDNENSDSFSVGYIIQIDQKNGVFMYEDIFNDASSNGYVITEGVQLKFIVTNTEYLNELEKIIQKLKSSAEYQAATSLLRIKLPTFPSLDYKDVFHVCKNENLLFRIDLAIDYARYGTVKDFDEEVLTFQAINKFGAIDGDFVIDYVLIEKIHLGDNTSCLKNKIIQATRT